jgi:hypothetical protein
MKNIMIRKIFFICFLLIAQKADSQEMWGISNSNFSGNMGLFLNPSTIVRAPYQYEINFIAADVFAENTFIYYPQKIKVIPNSIGGDFPDGKNYYPSGSGLQNGFAHALVIGPSYIRNKTDWAWGIHTAFRSEFSVTGVSAELGFLLYDGFRYPPFYGQPISAHPFTAASASWFEIGGTYGKVYRDNEKEFIKWAANGNLLIGMNGFYYDQRSLALTSVDTSTIVVHSFDATLTHATGNSFFGLRGAGLSTTLGATYMSKPNKGAFDCNMSNDKQRKYNYRIGASLIDIGAIYFFNQAEQMNTATTSDVIWNGVDTIKYGSLRELDTTIVSHLGGNISNKNFMVWLPLAMSIQFDYQVKPNIFANASIVNRIHFTANEIARGNQLNLSVRYERRRYEGALNFTMFEYKQPSLGLGLRYRFFVIGTDRLLQMLGMTDVKAFDFFFGIKFQFCKKPFSKGPDCPAYQGG